MPTWSGTLLRVAAESPADDAEPAPTVRSRARSIGIPEARLLEQIERGVLMLDGHPVTDLDTEAPTGTRIQVAGQ